MNNSFIHITCIATFCLDFFSGLADTTTLLTPVKEHGLTELYTKHVIVYLIIQS